MCCDKQYYLGLDIGTDSVGYAVTDMDYALLKYRGEPMWGTTLFEAGNDCADRRMHRTSRRRIDRRQQRTSLLTELFAPEIIKIDPGFFIRRRESMLFEEDSQCGVKIFAGEGITDQEYHKKYPTIHHLLVELMTSEEPHDIRLIYLACGWLVAHRGHFLFDVPADKVGELLDFSLVYQEFLAYFQEQQVALPWSAEIDAEKVLGILQMEAGVKKKVDAFQSEFFGGKKIPKTITEEFPFSRESIVKLLSGGSVKISDLYANDAYAELGNVTLSMNDEEFIQIASEVGEDGELLYILKKVKDCARGESCVSAGKVAIYEQHNKDLKWLKHFVKTYCPEKYNEFFRDAVADNYVFYSKNVKSCSEQKKVKTTASKEAFCGFVKKRVENIAVKSEDQASYDDMMLR